MHTCKCVSSVSLCELVFGYRDSGESPKSLLPLSSTFYVLLLEYSSLGTSRGKETPTVTLMT